MVTVAPPPPPWPPTPRYHVLPIGAHLVRIFDPTKYGATALTFRYNGPRERLDHHRPDAKGEPIDDTERGIYYAASTLSGCVVEVFDASHENHCGEKHVAEVRLTRAVRLLDLRGSGAMCAGSVAALAKVRERPLTQAWSRYFYEHPATYLDAEGLIYYNAHNDEESFALYERAETALEVTPNGVIRLDDDLLRPHIRAAARENNLHVMPY